MAMIGETPGIFCQCTNEKCGVLLKMGSDYKPGQVVECPECKAPFVISPESPSAVLCTTETEKDNSTGAQGSMLSPFAFLRSAATPESGKLRAAMKKDTLFAFPSPSPSELGAMLDLPDTDLLMSNFGNCHSIRNLTPSLEATVAPSSGVQGNTVEQMFPDDISDLSRINYIQPPTQPQQTTESTAVTLENTIAAPTEPASMHTENADNVPVNANFVQVPMPQRTANGGAHLSCRYCGKLFKKAGRLTTHERKHTGERPFQCTECSKSFRDSAALEGHIARQHREQPFHCNICHKGFSSKRQLMIHGRVHSGEKPFQCQVCHRKFSQEGNLHTHIRRHMVNFGLDQVTDEAGNELPGKKLCRLCGLCIDNDTDLKTHVKFHIKCGDLIKLQSHMTGSVFSYEADGMDGSSMDCCDRRDSSTSEMDMDRRDSIDSLVSSSASDGSPVLCGNINSTPHQIKTEISNA